MPPSNGRDSSIDKRDFDTNRPLLAIYDSGGDTECRDLHSRPESRISARRYSDGEDGLLNDVVEEIVERDRRRLAKEVVRICSFALGIVTCITAFSLYGPLFLTRLHYTQLRVNAVSIAAGVSMYLPVSIFGYLCDRYTPSPLALFSGTVFGIGYLLAAIVYKNGPPPDAGGNGYPFWVMVVAFVCVGTATSCMYLAAVTTCAKNFGRGKHKGIMLAIPIAAFGLSGMWQSQVGTYLLYERLEDGSHGDVDVFRYFIFLAALLFGIGVIGTFGLRIVDEDEEKYIDEAVEELERSGLLEESEFFRSRSEVRAAYGTFSQSDNADDEERTLSLTQTEEEREAARLEKEREEEERRKKNWLLNWETKVFLKDHTMWWLALGFFLVTGPGEAYINNHPELSHITTGLIGFGYGSAFSLCPIIISVVWGVENFGTNWGIVAMFPAAGAALWGLIYSRFYQDATDGGNGSTDGQCHGWKCFGYWALGCALSVWVAIAVWSVAWRSWKRRGVSV
ncbi:unnamed protein product [Aspergillus oryzae var. brunneus]|uniref:Probable transporter MCH1 n=2 Tax=Aspergillus oryzae TaxID=5062 RepID=A0AAN4Z0C7_ASPOZ|nr:unnamed protein product [Aspergillus oryzae]GMG50493.1 unnamed protein product [Aspergillus oryzae var. brunneus]